MNSIKLFTRNIKPTRKLINKFFKVLFGLHREIPFEVHFTSQVSNHEKIHIKGGPRFYKSMASSGNCYFSASNGICFGYNVLFAPGVKIISSNHSFTLDREPIEQAPVIIGDNAWIGANSVILPGVSIGENTIIGAMSLVNKSFPSNAIIAGNPAKIIGWLCSCQSKLNKTDRNTYICENCKNAFSIIDGGLTKVKKDE